MKNQYFSTLVLLYIFGKVSAQNGDISLGARPAAMGYTIAAMSDPWSVFNNPGGLGTLHGTHVLFAAEHRYSVAGLNSTGVAFVTNAPIGTAAVSLYRFGDDLYNESTIGLTYANQFGIGALGIRVNYLQTMIEGFGSRAAISLDFGGTVEIGNNLRFGALMRNLNRAKKSEFEDERYPTLLGAGVSYYPTNKLIINAEVEKDIDLVARIKAGMEYNFLPKFAFRTGIRTEPFTNHFGLGFKSWKIVIDYALSIDYRLGNIHQASLAYRLTK